MSKVPATAGSTRDDTWRYRRLGGSLLLSEDDLRLLDSLRPVCARCGGPVCAFSWSRPSLAERSVRFRAECHGAVEEQDVPFDDLPAIMAGGVQGAQAFTGGNRRCLPRT